MAKITRAANKAYFQTDDVPTEAQYIDTLDSTVNWTDDVVTTVGATGSDVLIPSEQAVREALNLKADSLGADDNYVTDAEKTKLANLSGTNSGNETTSTLGTLIASAGAVAITDNDQMAFTQTGSGNLLARLTWNNIKSTLKTYFDTLYGNVAGQSSSVDNEIALFSGTGGKTIKRYAGTGVLRADSGVISTDSDVTDLVSAASTTAAGKVEIATGAEVDTGTDDVRAISPKALADQTVLLKKTGGTMSGDITLGENAAIALDPAGSADGKFTGITVSGTAGAALAFGDLCYLAVADSRWELADADAISTSGDVLLAMCVLAAAGDGSATKMLLYGIIRADTAFPALTVGAPAYVSTTAGDIQVAQPSATDDVIRVVGYALTADELAFQPSNSYITHT